MPTNKTWDEQKHNSLEKVLSRQLNDPGVLASDMVLEALGELTGLLSDQINVDAMILRGLRTLEDSGGASMDVTIEAGLGLFADTAGWNGTRSRVRPLHLPAGVTLTVAPADATNPRIDLVVCKAAHYDAESETVEIKNVTTGAFTGQSKATRVRRTMRSTATYADLAAGTAELAILQGTPAASPSEPTPASGEIVLAAITVGAAVSVINQSDIEDRRVAARAGVSRPLWRGHIDSTGAVVREYAEGGASVAVTKTATGIYQVACTGFGDYVIGTPTIVQTVSDRIATVTGSNSTFSVWVRDGAAGFSAVDGSFLLTVEPLTFDGGTAY